MHDLDPQATTPLPGAGQRDVDAPEPARRHWMKRAARAVGLGATAGTAGAQMRGGASAPAGAAGAASSRPDVHRDAILALLDRATWGFETAMAEDARALGFEAWREQQLDHLNVNDDQMAALLAPFPSLDMTLDEMLTAYPPDTNGDAVVAGMLRGARVVRARSSNRQLFERVVEFWTDHFTVPGIDGPLRYLKTLDDRDAIRAHALGNFRGLLGASAKSPAMLYYLDNYRNFAGAPNENYARELMELHTLGVDGGYDETDVVEVARCLTGWTFDNQPGPNQGAFVFDPATHDPNTKWVLGTEIPAGGGQQDGETVLDLLAGHPSTAAFLARKLCTFFLTYDTPQATVDRVASTFLSTGGDIKSVLREVLSERSFREANVWEAPRLERPMQFAIAALRSTGAVITNTPGLVGELVLMGHHPYAWPAPNGYPDSIGAWGTSVLPRWGYASRLLDGGIADVEVPNSALLSLLGGVPQFAAARAINLGLYGGRMSDVDLAELQAFVDSRPVLNGAAAREAVALALSLASTQWA